MSADDPRMPPMPPRRPWLDVGLVVLLTFFALMVRQWHLGLPETRYFDETYYSKSGTELISGKSDSNTVHPPMAKLIIATLGYMYNCVAIPLQEAGWVGGVNDFSPWRAGSLLFGLLTIPLTYALAFRLFRSRFAAVVAGFLLGLDFLHFVQSRITMLDMYLAFFVLLGAYAAWRFIESDRDMMGWAVLSVLSFAIGFSCKWNSLFAGFGAFVAMLVLKPFPPQRATVIDRMCRFLGLVVVATPIFRTTMQAIWPYSTIGRWRWGLAIVVVALLILEIARVTRWLPPLKAAGLWFTRISMLYLFFLPAIYLTAFVPFMWLHHWDMQASFKDAKANHELMFHFRYGKEFTHRYMSNYWAWPTMLRPVWYHYEEHKTPDDSLFPPRTDTFLGRVGWRGQEPETYVTGILAMGSPFVWWTYLIFLLLTVLQSIFLPLYTVIDAFFRRRFNEAPIALPVRPTALPPHVEFTPTRHDGSVESRADVRPAGDTTGTEAGRPIMEPVAVAALDEVPTPSDVAVSESEGGVDEEFAEDGSTEEMPVFVAPPRAAWKRALDNWRFGSERPWLFLMLLYFPQILFWRVNRGFLFYMLPCVPFMCIFIGGILREWLELPFGRLCAAVYLTVATLFFVAYFPIIAGWSIPKPVYEVLIFTPKWI